MLLPTSDIDLVIQPANTKSDQQEESSDDMKMSPSSSNDDESQERSDKEEEWNEQTGPPLRRVLGGRSTE